MGAVFASATRGPLTALASVVELSGDFTLTCRSCSPSPSPPPVLPERSATAPSTPTKLLRRGIDIDRPHTDDAFTQLTVADAMPPLPPTNRSGQPRAQPRSRKQPGTPTAPSVPPATAPTCTSQSAPASPANTLGPLTRLRRPQALFSNESLAQAMRQLVLYGRDGRPCSPPTDTTSKAGSPTRTCCARPPPSSPPPHPDITAGHLAAEWHTPTPPRGPRPGTDSLVTKSPNTPSPTTPQQSGDASASSSGRTDTSRSPCCTCAGCGDPHPHIRLQPGEPHQRARPLTADANPGHSTQLTHAAPASTRDEQTRAAPEGGTAAQPAPPPPTFSVSHRCRIHLCQ